MPYMNGTPRMRRPKERSHSLLRSGFSRARSCIFDNRRLYKLVPHSLFHHTLRCAEQCRHGVRKLPVKRAAHRDALAPPHKCTPRCEPDVHNAAFFFSFPPCHQPILGNCDRLAYLPPESTGCLVTQIGRAIKYETLPYFSSTFWQQMTVSTTPTMTQSSPLPHQHLQTLNGSRVLSSQAPSAALHPSFTTPTTNAGPTTTGQQLGGFFPDWDARLGSDHLRSKVGTILGGVPNAHDLIPSLLFASTLR